MKPQDKTLLATATVVGSGVMAWRKFCPWIAEDIKVLLASRKQSDTQNEYAKREYFIINMFEEAVQKSPNKPFIIFEDREYSYKFMDEQANRVANIAYNWGLKFGETVAIMFTNEPAFVWTFLGLQKIGLAAAFINHHLRGQALLHTISACEAKVLIVGEEERLLNSTIELKSDLDNIPVYVSGRRNNCPFEFLDWTREMEMALPVPVCKSSRQLVKGSTPCCYIFTSGTTGLPKPCFISQTRAISYSTNYQKFGFRSDDRVYTTTPFYHSVASGLGLMNVLEQGATMVLRRKFSAHHFWDDVRRHNVTFLQYIGELCRYLLAVEPSPLDGVHSVRCAIGNGLRQDIWVEFKERFRIPNIHEFFGSTEGVFSCVNMSNKVGSCGRTSPFLNMTEAVPKYLVKCNLDTGEIYRDKNGHCIPIQPGETGMVIGGVPRHYTKFRFYKASQEENMKKIIQNVFRPGDAYFCFGDLLYLDKDYFLYFRDRVGDTFRWKGENVSTFEVANILTSMESVHDANVYGVQIPGNEGRAGMASLFLKKPMTNEDLASIYRHCQDNLPSYARPVFLRFPKDVDETTTFKQRKVDFVKQGYDPALVTDPLFYKDDTNQTYSELDTTALRQLLSRSKL